MRCWIVSGGSFVSAAIVSTASLSVLPSRGALPPRALRSAIASGTPRTRPRPTPRAPLTPIWPQSILPSSITWRMPSCALPRAPPCTARVRSALPTPMPALSLPMGTAPVIVLAASSPALMPCCSPRMLRRNWANVLPAAEPMPPPAATPGKPPVAPTIVPAMDGMTCAAVSPSLPPRVSSAFAAQFGNGYGELR